MIPAIPGVSGNSLLPYKFVGNSHEFIRQTGIPAHPCLTEVTLAREEALVATIDFMEGLLMPLAMLLLKVRILIDKVLNSKIVLIKLYKVSF